MKFLMAPQSMIVKVLMVFEPEMSFTGILKVLSLGSATSTWAGSWEEDIKTSFRFKNPLCSRI